MQRIINGKRYNTDTATAVLDLDNGHSRSDFKYEETALYLTAKGKWFLAGSGNAMSRWATQYGNSTGPGAGVEPLSDDQALSILEHHGATGLIERHFSSKIVDA
jgi:hypothetical protein